MGECVTEKNKNAKEEEEMKRTNSKKTKRIKGKIYRIEL